MISLKSYKQALSSHGQSIGNIRKTQSNIIMNETFTHDPTYKQVYILTKDGWKFEDAKYQFHSAQSISKDQADYYLQFRTGVHFPIGSYVIVPDDTMDDIGLDLEELKNPFLQPINKRSNWWIIVGRDNANAYVRYMILKCDWDFKWVYKGKVMSCWACSRSANSYTSGVWADEISASLDDLTSSWLPDTFHVYGDKLESLGMSDTRTIMHGQRFFMSNNDLDPKIYEVTKIKDISPQGIIKLSIKQDELDKKRDNIELRVCDYYSINGDIQVNEPVLIEPDDSIRDMTTSTIYWMDINEDGELDYANMKENKSLHIGQSSYFKAESNYMDFDPEWRITLIGEYSDEDKKYYEGLIKITEFNNSSISIKPGKANSLIDKKFLLSVSDKQGNYYSSIEVEVVK